MSIESNVKIKFTIKMFRKIIEALRIYNLKTRRPPKIQRLYLETSQPIDLHTSISYLIILG